MKYAIAPVKNVVRLSQAGDALINRTMGLPGMGLIWGPSGFGKTTAATWFINRCDGVYVRAMATWTPSAMLACIMRELDIEASRSCALMVERIIQKLAETNRPLFIDEADYLIENKKMVETLRDLHDLSTVPVILIGMAGIQRKIMNRQQLAGRISQWVEFAPCDLDDAKRLANTLCEVVVNDDLLIKLHAKANGSARLLVVGLSQIESFARARGMDRLGAGDWDGSDFFLGANQGVRGAA